MFKILLLICVSTLAGSPRNCLVEAEKNELGRFQRPDTDSKMLSDSGHFYIHYDTLGNDAPDLKDSNGNGFTIFILAIIHPGIME